MRWIKSGLSTIAFAGFFGGAVVVGCTADGGVADLSADKSSTEDEDGGGGVILPPPSGSTSSGGSSGGSSGTPVVDSGITDSGKKDAGKPDAAVDAGAPPPVPGDACTTLNEIVKKDCGACGKQSTVCIATGSSGGQWSGYSPCEGQLPNGCDPTSPPETIACGNCGTQTRTCSKFCAWTTSTCSGQPVGACTPGSVDIQSAGCPVLDTYRQRTCQANCVYDNFTAECKAPPTTIEVGSATGNVTNTMVTLRSAQVGPRVTGSCPNATVTSGTQTPYVFTQVHNGNTKTAVVSVYNTQAPGGPIIDTIMASYANATPPADDNAKKACVQGVGDYGNTTLVIDGSFASLDATRNVTIAPGATVTIYTAAYYAFDPSDPAESTGKVMVNVKVVQLN